MKGEVKIGLYNQQKLFFLFSLCCFYITITSRTIRFDLLDFKTQMHHFLFNIGHFGHENFLVTF